MEFFSSFYYANLYIKNGGENMFGSAIIAWVGFTWSSAMTAIATIFALLS